MFENSTWLRPEEDLPRSNCRYGSTVNFGDTRPKGSALKYPHFIYFKIKSKNQCMTNFCRVPFKIGKNLPEDA